MEDNIKNGENKYKEVYEKIKLNFYRNIFARLSKREGNLTAAEAFCVEVIYGLDLPTVNELADFLNMSQPNMTYRINKLVEKGYVKKIPSQEDKREVFLDVTEKFRKYYDVKTRYMDIVIDRTKEKISKEDYDKFNEVLSLISEELMFEINNEAKRFKF